MTVTARGIRIPQACLRWKFTRSGGAGGQHVNTADTRVELYCDITGLLASDTQMERLLEALGPEVRIVESSRRSQLQNRQAAMERLISVIDRSCATARRRRPTRPTRSSVESRLKSKRIESVRKQSRRDMDQE